jgi:hypothetical protein
MSTELTTINTGPALFRQSTDAAGMCKEIVLKTARKIQGRQYVQVEGWQSIAIAHGCVASASQVEKVAGGFRALGVVRRMDTGQVIAESEGFVGDDESMWAKRPEYARRAMAQTRAISRACRAAFAHVVVMMNAGLSTTPAEEVPDDGFDDQPPPRNMGTVEVELLAKLREAAMSGTAELLRVHTTLKAAPRYADLWKAESESLKATAAQADQSAAQAQPEQEAA